MDHRDIDLFPLACGQTLAQAVLVVDIHAHIGYHARAGHLDQIVKHIEAGGENGDVAPELIDDGGLDNCPFVGFQQGHRAVKLSEHAAPVDIAHQQHRRICHFCHAHIDDIFAFQVDFGRAACAFDHDDIIFSRKRIVGPHDIRHQLFFILEIIHGAHVAAHLAVHDHLRAYVGGGFQKDGIHQNARLHAGGLGLRHLGTAHLQPLFRNKGIERHVLGFKGNHPVAVLSEDPAERRAEKAFSRVRHGALYHNGLCFFHLSASRSAASSASFSAWLRTAIRTNPFPSPT